MVTAPEVSRPPGLQRLMPLLPAPLLAVATVWVLMFNPIDRIPDPTGPCLWHATFGIDGPSCGGTRMFYHLIHGDFVLAAQHHLVALIGLLVAGYYWIAWAGRWMFGFRLPMPRPAQWLIIGYIAVFLLYSTVLRNLPWEPFTWFYVPDLTP